MASPQQITEKTAVTRKAGFAASKSGANTGRIESLLFDAAENWPAKTAVVDGGQSITYKQLARFAAGFAAEIAMTGVSPGDRVAIFLDKTTDSIVAMFGAWLAGAIVVPLNERLKSRQVAHILQDSGAALMVSSARKLARIDRASYTGVGVIETSFRSDGGAPLNEKETFKTNSQPGGGAMILYTSGSTGLPKGILLSHANLLAGTRIVSRYLGVRHEERILSVLPFSFDYGLNQLLTAVNAGATIVLIRSHLAADVCRALAEKEITACAGVPPFWIHLMSDRSPFRTMEFPKLRYITNSGGAFPAEILSRYRKHLPHCSIFLMYGLTEAFRSSYLPPELMDRYPGSIGKAIPETELLVADESGNECGPNEVGELVHRGPTVAMGYWNDPEATARVFRPDTLKGGDPNDKVVFSGDLVRKDEDGFLYFVGRRDQMIKSQGFRISPEEVEEYMVSSPFVSEVAVCGREDPERGAVIVAHVVPVKSGAFNLLGLIRHCQQEMPNYMQPREIILHDSLPRTPSGKIDRKSLR